MSFNQKIFLLLTFSLSHINVFVFAQEDKTTVVTDTLYRVEMNDGNIFIGEIVDMNKEKIILKSKALNQVTLHRRFIISIERIDSRQSTVDQWYRNVQSARYFFAPNGYGLKKGESYYQNIWVFYNQYTVALSDYFSLGIGIMPFFFFDFAPTPIWITPKFSIPIAKDKINLGVGALVADVLGDNSGAFGITYSTVTFGNVNKNISLGFGFAFADERGSLAPLINFGGLIRVSMKTYLMTENYIFTNGTDVGGFVLLGARTMINRSAIDYGLGLPLVPGDNTFIGIPWLGLTVPFRKK